MVGLILGDAHLGQSESKFFITLEQSSKHKSYVYYFYNLLVNGGLVLNDIRYYSRSDKRYSRINESSYFKSYNTELLTFLSIFLSENSVKIIPLNIKEWLTPIALAHWVCGDGQLVEDGGITLCTDNYTLAEVNLLIDALTNNFSANCTIKNKKGKSGIIYHRIYISKNSFDSIKPLIVDHVH